MPDFNPPLPQCPVAGTQHPPSRGRSLLGHLWTFGLFLCFAGSAAASDRTRERFLIEAPKAWDSYIQYAKHLQGTLKTEHLDKATQKVLNRWNREFKQNGCWTLQIDQQPASDLQDWRVVGKNSRYAFQIRRRGENGTWVVTKLDLGVHDGVSDGIGLPCNSVFMAACAPILIYNQLLPDMVKSSEFTLKHVELASYSGEDMIRVKFDHRPKEDRGHPNPLRGGWVVLDPARHWIIREYEVGAVWPDAEGVMSAIYEYEEDTKPVIKRIVRRQRAARTKVDHEYVTEYHLREDHAVPESEFMLTAFGLPEPGGTQESHLYVWVILAGISCLALAFIFRRRSVVSQGH